MATDDEQDKERIKLVTAIWLKIANVRMIGNAVEFQVEGDASDDRERTWLPYGQDKPEPLEMYKMVVKALQDSRKTSGKLMPESNALKISEVCVQFQ